MDCPNCGLINLATAERCDCGYNFLTRQRPTTKLQGQEVRHRNALRQTLIITLGINRMVKQESIDCPKCGLINLATSERCDCGYDFFTRQLGASDQAGPTPELHRQEVRHRNAMRLFYAGYAIFVFLVLFLWYRLLSSMAQ